MVHLYAAPSEYMALGVQAALSKWSVPCLIFSNEIPMRPGYIFGADLAYADLYIEAEDQAIANAVLHDTLEIMCAEDRGAETAYPRRINLRGGEWLGLVLCVSWSLLLAPVWVYGLALVLSPFLSDDLDDSATVASLLMLALFFILDFVFVCGLIYLNWVRAKRIVQAIGLALLGLLALPLLLSYELLRWCWEKLTHLVPWRPESPA